MSVPWFMLSPSPISLLQYGLLSYVLGNYFKSNIVYKRWPHLQSFIDGFFVTAFFVVLGDAVWCSLTIIRWLPYFPEDAFQIYASFFRDLAAITFFWLIIRDNFIAGTLKLRKAWLWFSGCALTQCVWFMLSPSMAYTNYVYGYLIDAPFTVLLFSFFLSHFLTRLPLWMAVLSTRG